MYPTHHSTGMVLARRWYKDSDAFILFLGEHEARWIHVSGVRKARAKFRAFLEPATILQIATVQGRRFHRLTGAVLLQPSVLLTYPEHLPDWEQATLVFQQLLGVDVETGTVFGALRAVVESGQPFLPSHWQYVLVHMVSAAGLLTQRPPQTLAKWQQLSQAERQRYLEALWQGIAHADLDSHATIAAWIKKVSSARDV